MITIRSLEFFFVTFKLNENDSIEAEPEPAFSAPPKQIEEKKTTANTVVGHKIEARVEDGNKTILKGLRIAALALGMAALTIVTGGAALAVAGALMEGGLISTAIGAGVAVAAGVGTGMGLEGAAMEANVAEATVEEGNNEINNGNQGIDEKGYNRIRDGELGGDEEAYQKYQDKAIGLWETGVMINITAATAGTEALPVAGAADMYLGSKFSNVLSEDGNIISNNPLLESDGNLEAEKLANLRNSLPDKYQEVDSFGNKTGNIAYSTSEVEGYEIDEMKAFSKYGSQGKNGIKNPVDGWVSSVPEPAYSKDVLKVNWNNEVDSNGYLRNNDTKYKLIEQYNTILNGDYEVKGTITIVSEREVCPSCENVIKAFSKD